MHIDRTGRPAAAAAARRQRTATSFTPPDEESVRAPRPEPHVAAPGLVPLSLLADQADPSPPLPNATCAAHGAAVLDALAGLQTAALGGGGGPARQTLSDLAQSLPEAAEPGLAAVLQAIAQRAAIELARAG